MKASSVSTYKSLLFIALMVSLPSCLKKVPSAELHSEVKSHADVGRFSMLNDQLITVLDAFKQDYQTQPSYTARDYSGAALLAVANDESSTEAQAFLQHLFDSQNIEEGSPQYGMFRTATNDDSSPYTVDEFAYQNICVIFSGFSDRFPDDFVQHARPYLKASLYAVQYDDLAISYTNMYLIKALNTILLGQLLKDELQAHGEQLFKSWIDYTAQNGIAEYYSPTYYGVNALTLNVGYLYATNLNGECKRALDFLWTGVSANQFNDKLTGSHGRDNDFMTGHGGIELLTYIEEMSNDPNLNYLIGLDKATLTLMGHSNSYHPSSEIKALATLPERLILERWGPELGQDRVTYIAPGFSVSSASANLNTNTSLQDKPIAINLKSSLELPNITIVPDGYNAPWGAIKDKGKPKHYPLGAVSVQDKGVLLTLLNINPREKPAGSDLGTNVILPWKAEHTYINHQEVKVTNSLKRNVGYEDVMAQWHEGTAVIVRFFYAEDYAAQETALIYQGDGTKYGGTRLTHYHNAVAPKGTALKNTRAGVLFVTQSCDSENELSSLIDSVKDANILVNDDSNALAASVTLFGKRYKVSLDKATSKPKERSINDQPADYPFFTINGKSITL